MQRMTSTASSTFIEEENAELVETTMAMKNKDVAYVTSAVAARINDMIKTTTKTAVVGDSTGQVTGCEINYAEFSVGIVFFLAFLFNHVLICVFFFIKA